MEIQLSFSKVVKKVSPSVVNVYSSKTVTQRRSVFNNDDFFERFFNNRNNRNRSRVQKSLGSGVVVDKSGLVVTNYHVIKGSDKIVVVTKDKAEYDAEVILADERTDLAVLRLVTDDEFVAMKFADSEAVEVGDLTLAIGNPFGVGQTVTFGIVSAVGRNNAGISDFQFFIQTDAAINPGNSGGALVDSLGRLIGVNTAIFTRSGGSNGIGFAIPSNMVRLVVDSALMGKDIKRPWLGVKLRNIDSDIAESFGQDKASGVLVVNSVIGSPIYDAGIVRGDIINAIDGKRADSKEILVYILAGKAIGDQVSFRITRNGVIMNIGVEMIATPELPLKNATIIAGDNPFSGAEIVNISPLVIEEMSLPLNSKGVIISKLGHNSNAIRYGFRIGDVILSVSDRVIRNVEDLSFVHRQKKRFWRFSINRNGRIINNIVSG